MAYKIDILNVEWKKLKSRDLDDKIFNDNNINEWLIHEFIVMQHANARLPIAHTKTRWEVSMSWRKLYRQKWTWRARPWDAASPVRRKGWVAFGPRNDVNYHKDMPKKMRRKALLWSLSLKARDNEIMAIDSYPIKEIKTKKAYDVLTKLWVQNDKLLFVIPSSDEIMIKSFRNIWNVKYVIVDYLNPLDLLTHKKVLFVENALDKMSEIFTK